TLSNRIVEVDVLERDAILLPDSAFLDPGTGRWLPAESPPITAWRIQERHGGVVVESWIDEDGRVLRSSSPLGFSMERSPFELARQARDEDRIRLASRDAPGTDLILSTAIQSHVDLGRVEDHRELRFLLEGVDLD